MGKLTVTGEGKVEHRPEVAYVSFDVSAESKVYGECLDGLNLRVAELKDAIESAGIPRSNVKTTSFSVHTWHDKKKGTYFRASHEMTLELPSDKKVMNDVLSAVTRSAGSPDIYISFDVKDRRAMRKSALESAVRAAKESAQVLAEAAGVRLGKLEEIVYGWKEVHFYDRRFRLASSDAREAGADIEPEDVEARASVTLVYEIS